VIPTPEENNLHYLIVIVMKRKLKATMIGYNFMDNAHSNFWTRSAKAPKQSNG